MSAARDAVLGRVRDALGSSPVVPEVPREYRRAAATTGEPPAAAIVERFCERVADYKATVTRVASPSELPAALVAAAGGERVVRAPGVDPVDGLAGLVVDDPPLPIAELDAVDAVLTGCFLAIAETGTIILDGGPASGRRALSLVPDHHLCVVLASDIVRGLPEAITALEPVAREGRPITMISGPSATSDIELERVEGVHGPRRLDVFVVG